MNASSGVLLIVAGLALLYLAVTGRLNKIVAALNEGGSGLVGKAKGIAGGDKDNCEFGYNEALGQCRTKKNPYADDTASYLGSDIFSDIKWPMVTQFSSIRPLS